MGETKAQQCQVWDPTVGKMDWGRFKPIWLVPDSGLPAFMYVTQVSNAMPGVWGLTHVQAILLSLSDPLARISHQQLLPTRVHAMCLYSKNYSALIPFLCVSHPRDVPCLRPGHSSPALHEFDARSEARHVPPWCVLNLFSGCLLNCRNHLTPAASSLTQLFLCFLVHYPAWSSWWKLCTFTTEKCYSQYNFTSFFKWFMDSGFRV